ncbi:uncharacterized protein J4E87_003739 [Alternaria ethzedia]|uniref:uncharacterized protein n=1 Tax=Alternaria ethzedia TaxID=181014 RepID=UPI0020C32E84|nr:uncharacterized protein J4E87_003739 [Alternaria ethzedia]KAI4629475.1 hypothetical protein J4E87_003739 [Alternaria ethzedia]
MSPFSIGTSTSSSTRASALAEKRAGWEYGPSIAGNTAFYPAGSIGGPVAKAQGDRFEVFSDELSTKNDEDAKAAQASIVAAGGLNTLDDYAKLYNGLWKESAPKGPYPGLLTNYTNDLLFSMTQLSDNPYKIVRVSKNAKLPFSVSNADAISGQTLEALQSSGRLFLADYLDQKHQPHSAGKYGAACQAYFYIDPKSQNFLPLAIKSNAEGSDLVYTPHDSPNDWLLAKMMFNLNSFWYAQWYHLGATHAVSEIVYLSAIRTLSEEHPVMAILHRLMKDAWAFRVIGRDSLINPGGPIDQLFPWSGSQAGNYTDSLYHSGESSAFQANFFETNLKRRGLIDSSFGPEIKSFPFYRDASVIHAAIRRFMTTFVESYYKDASAIIKDNELQAWIHEAVPAQIEDFPSTLKDKQTLIDILTHMAHLVSVVHGTLNTNALAASTGVLPFHPLAFYSPLPTAKGVTDIMPFMPQVEAAIGQISLVVDFNRPTFVNSEETTSHMFDNTTMLARMGKEVENAERDFRFAMKNFSAVIRDRKFGEDGLCGDMPYCWTTLDPDTASYWLTI